MLRYDLKIKSDGDTHHANGFMKRRAAVHTVAIASANGIKIDSFVVTAREESDGERYVRLANSRMIKELEECGA